ncbi:MAG: sigma-54-dependent Fis family transcriptional regulator [Acidobacteria bacterium]|nr:sigma-54-dependent Fis family transcriptional regulator [Acidobacteriota bacterium]
MVDGVTDKFMPMLLGESGAVHLIREQVRTASATDAPVLLTGESGTGKEVVARLLHQWSSRSRASFVKVNCPAIPNELFESELFGHEPGAFTGATSTRIGKFEQANRGSLFLDEIGELDFSLQSKLLQVLQDFRVTRLGSNEERNFNVRLICATNRQLEREVDAGSFRADLFYRINVLRIVMPPLRKRSSDVPFLMKYFVQHYADRFGMRPAALSPSAMRLLEEYHWPGNIRELENLAKSYVVLGSEEQMLALLREPRGEDAYACLPIDLTTPLRIQSRRVVQHLERRIILGVLQAHQWNRRKAARTLDISYRALLYKIKEAGLPSLKPHNAASPRDSFEDKAGL